MLYPKIKKLREEDNHQKMILEMNQSGKQIE
jgi:hypothetical protein